MRNAVRAISGLTFFVAGLFMVYRMFYEHAQFFGPEYFLGIACLVVGTFLFGSIEFDD